MNDLAARFATERWIGRVLDSLPHVLAAILILVLAYVAFRATRPPLEAVLRRMGLHETLIHLLLMNIYRWVVFVFGLVMAADQLGINVAAALAGIGVVGIAVGFAAQDTLANTIAGFVIFLDKPFEVGEWVTVAGEYGRVSNITMRSTRIRTNNNTYVVIPNRKIIDEILVNHSKHGDTRIVVPVGIAYQEDVVAARDVLLDAVAKLDGVLRDPAPDVVTVELGPSSVHLHVRVWIRDAALEQPVFFRALEASKRALDAAGMQIPYPHFQLSVEKVEDRVWERMERWRQRE